MLTRTMLARHFGYNNEEITIPTNLDGSSIGPVKAEFPYKLASEALNQNGSKLGGHKLHIITEFPGGSRFWDGHITPTQPGTGKRKVFYSDSETE
ncbi:unnamed protein product [Urochloa humidicola]